jgi:osmotically-inducible protein OsmY
MTTTITDFDQALRNDVTRQLACEPAFDASMVGVTTAGGIATLSGYVDTREAKLAVEQAAWRVYGVRAVANELAVRFVHDRIDPDIARDALDALKHHIHVPPGIGVTVREGDITLTGTVEWMFQKMAAGRAVRYLKGVRDVFNDVVITQKVSPKDVQTHVLEALHRHADLDARLVRVTADDGSVILDGTVRSWSDKDEAFRAAWAAPGVITVNNRLVVVPQELAQ